MAYTLHNNPSLAVYRAAEEVKEDSATGPRLSKDDDGSKLEAKVVAAGAEPTGNSAAPSNPRSSHAVPEAINSEGGRLVYPL